MRPPPPPSPKPRLHPSLPARWPPLDPSLPSYLLHLSSLTQGPITAKQHYALSANLLDLPLQLSSPQLALLQLRWDRHNQEPACVFSAHFITEGVQLVSQIFNPASKGCHLGADPAEHLPSPPTAQKTRTFQSLPDFIHINSCLSNLCSYLTPNQALSVIGFVNI